VWLSGTVLPKPRSLVQLRLADNFFSFFIIKKRGSDILFFFLKRPSVFVYNIMNDDVIACAIKNGNRNALSLHPTFLKGFRNRGKILTKLVRSRQVITPENNIIQNALDWGKRNALAFHKNFHPGDKNRNRKLTSLIKLFKSGKVFDEKDLYMHDHGSTDDFACGVIALHPLKEETIDCDLVAEPVRDVLNLVNEANLVSSSNTSGGNENMLSYTNDNQNLPIFSTNLFDESCELFDHNDDNNDYIDYFPVYRFTSVRRESNNNLIGENLFENYHSNLEYHQSLEWSCLYWKDNMPTRYWNIQHIHECLPWKIFEAKYAQVLLIFNQSVSLGDYGIRVAIHAHHFAGCGFFAAAPLSDCVDGTPSEYVNGSPNWNLQKVRVLPLFKSLVEVCGFNPSMVLTGRSPLSLFHAFASSLFSITRRNCKVANLLLKASVKWLLKEGNVLKKLDVQTNGCRCTESDLIVPQTILDIWLEETTSLDIKTMCSDYTAKMSLLKKYFVKFDHYNESTYRSYFPKMDRYFIKALSDIYCVSVIVFDYLLKKTFTYTDSNSSAHMFLYKVSEVEYFGVFDIDAFVN
jgi:hypothetical protein